MADWQPLLSTFVKSGVAKATGGFQTTSTSFVDVTNPAVVTISGLTASETYTCIAFFTGCQRNNGVDNTTHVGLKIDGTMNLGNVNEMYQVAGGTEPGFTVVGIKTGITGKTTFDVAGQIKVSAGTGEIQCDLGGGDNLKAAAINVMIFRTS